MSVPLRNHILECLVQRDLPNGNVEIDPVPVQAVWKKLLMMKLREKRPNASLCENSVFQINIKTSHEDANKECSMLFAKCDKSILFPVQCKKSMAASDEINAKNHFNHSAIQRAIQSLKSSDFADLKLESPDNFFPGRLDYVQQRTLVLGWTLQQVQS